MITLSDKISDYLLNLFGEEYLEKYKEYIGTDADYYLRISPFEDEAKVVTSLKEYDVELEPVANIPLSYKIVSGYSFAGKTLEFALGKYYIQSLSSMIPPLVLAPGENDVVLDLCAAPGSKSTQLSELMQNKGTLYSNEISIKRLASLVHNFEKMRAANVGVIQYKGELLSKVYENYFDKILVDAPCSALGIVQRKGEVSNWWNEKQMNKIAALQLRLLISAIKMARVGGEIVYSTCTLTVEENEYVINKVLEKYPVEILDVELPVKSVDGLTNIFGKELNPEVSKCRRIIPWEINSEGFFIAKLRKIDETEPTRKDRYKHKDVKILSANNGLVKEALRKVEYHFGVPFEHLKNYKYIVNGKDIFFIHSEWKEETIEVFNRIGLKFGRFDKYGNPQLTSQAAQLFGKLITKNLVELTKKEDVEVYFAGGKIRGLEKSSGQKIVKYKDYILGAAIAVEDGLKSQFPRSLRTGNIIIL
ncbi:MAG: NOL1/NOP2/sun family putative RNA methylase [Chlorobi bacterium]|nr:NOL1/NOP2/sun family putative RNA methylase [Chlorobiota bacterium]